VPPAVFGHVGQALAQVLRGVPDHGVSPARALADVQGLVQGYGLWAGFVDAVKLGGKTDRVGSLRMGVGE
jgi:hypothetical protein